MTCGQRIVWRLGDRRHRFTAVVERTFDPFGDELVTRLEVPVEAAVRHSRVAHQGGHPDPVDPVLAKTRRGDTDDLVVVLALVRPRMSHGLPSRACLTA